MKRSASLFRDRWGQQVTGNVVIGGAAGLILLVGVLLGVFAVVLLATGSTLGLFGGGFLLAAGVVVAIGAAIFAGATKGVFGVALYHYMVDNRPTGPFSDGDLEAAVRTR